MKIREGTASTVLSRDGATISYISMGEGLRSWSSLEHSPSRLATSRSHPV